MVCVTNEEMKDIEDSVILRGVVLVVFPPRFSFTFDIKCPR
jgi:hypothetical protein